MGDEEGVGEEGAGEDAACFEVMGGVARGERDECVAEGLRQEDGAEWGAVFEMGGGGKGVRLRGRCSRC